MGPERVCAMCRFFQIYDEKEGFCRRFPPTFIGGQPTEQAAWLFPVVANDGGCGESQGYITPGVTPW